MGCGQGQQGTPLTFPLPSGGSSLGQEVLPLPPGKPERESQRMHSPRASASAWTGGRTCGLPSWALRGRCVLGRATSLAILVTARLLPDPGLPQDQPQRLGRQPRPPFPAW